jgi:ribosomal protein L24E
MYVFKDGKITYFCSSKCYKNAIVNGRKLKGAAGLTMS